MPAAGEPGVNAEQRLRRLRLERRRHGIELRAQRRADAPEGPDKDNRDERNDQAILDGRCAGVVREKTLERFDHCTILAARH